MIFFINSVANIRSTFTPSVLSNYPQSVFVPPTSNFSPISLATLAKLISRPSSKAQGVDEIPIHYLVKTSPVVLEDILMIINNSLSTSTFPTLWKSAIIKPIPKIAKPTDVSHFRPFSLLCSLSKILESVVYEQLRIYLTSIEAFDPLQSGFKKYHSTLLKNASIKLIYM